jgi:FG-GAP repeat
MARFESRSDVKFAVLILALFASSLLATPATSYAFSRSSGVVAVTLTSPNAQPLGEFGTSVASTGNAVIVGAPLESAGGDSDAGHVYAFSSAGALIGTITSPNVQTGGEFGSSVATGSGVVVVGAPLESAGGFEGAGHAYTYNASNGALISKLTSPNAQSNGAFGASVAVYGNTVVVGAMGESVDGLQGAGRAYTFNAETGALISTLTSPNAQKAGGFGVSVAISNSFVAVGAWSETVNGVIVGGRAYTFNPTTGALFSTLISPNLQSAGEFGFSVAASGTTVAVGAWSETVGADTIAGRVYTFNGESGALMETFVSPTPQDNAQFGFSVALSGTALVVGARGVAVGADPAAGHVYSFNAATGALERTVISSNPQSEGEFGFSVAIGGKVVVVGALLEAADGYASAGHAYSYTL